MPVYAYLDICASITTLMLIISLYIRKQTRGRNNMLFLCICFVILIQGLTDAANIYFDNLIAGNSFDYLLSNISHYIYFLVRNFSTPLYLLFVCSQIGIWHKISKGNIHHYLWPIPYIFDALFIITNPFTHYIFSIEHGTLNYSRGVLIYLLYFVAFFYISIIIVLLNVFRYQIPKHRFLLLVAFLPINAIAVFLQMVYPNYRFEIISSTMLVLVLTVGVQRPEEMIDPVVRTMSNNAFIMDMRIAYKSKRPMSVLFLHFANHGSLRSNLGLFAYHDLLIYLTTKINQICRIMSLYPDIYYLDGGTFAVVGSKADNEILLDMGRMLHAYMQEPVKSNNYEVIVDTRVCLVKCPDDIDSYNGFMTLSRSFQHKIKETGRVAILSNVTSSRDFQLNSQIDNIISRAIENNSFEMYYQPIYSIKENKFVSAEALIRLKDEEFGYVSPALFIPAAEKNGAIHQIGDFVIESVCQFISSINFEALHLEYIELNLSVSQCIEPDFEDKIVRILNKYGVSPGKINLEITETAVDSDPTVTDYNIRQLSRKGFSFSLDDYGTGYSNITRVVSLPLDIVKLDKCLVDELDSNQMWIVIKDTVRMLKRMGKKILVEGVETEHAYKRFESIGCDYVQGYFFSKPLNKEDYLNFIREYNY